MNGVAHTQSGTGGSGGHSSSCCAVSPLKQTSTTYTLKVEETGWNGIKSTTNGDKTLVTMFIDGIPAAWVEYDLQQIEGLIRHLEAAKIKLQSKS